MRHFLITPSTVAYTKGALVLKCYIDERIAEIKRLDLSCVLLFLIGAHTFLSGFRKPA